MEPVSPQSKCFQLDWYLQSQHPQGPIPPLFSNSTMPGLLHLPPEVLTLIVEEVCITAELDNLVQTVTVELECPPGDAVDECLQRHRPLNVLGGEQTVRYAGSRLE